MNFKWLGKYTQHNQFDIGLVYSYRSLIRVFEMYYIKKKDVKGNEKNRRWSCWASPSHKIHITLVTQIKPKSVWISLVVSVQPSSLWLAIPQTSEASYSNKQKTNKKSVWISLNLKNDSTNNLCTVIQYTVTVQKPWSEKYGSGKKKKHLHHVYHETLPLLPFR